jgi:hypothetical protein
MDEKSSQEEIAKLVAAGNAKWDKTMARFKEIERKRGIDSSLSDEQVQTLREKSKSTQKAARFQLLPFSFSKGRPDDLNPGERSFQFRLIDRRGDVVEKYFCYVRGREVTTSKGTKVLRFSLTDLLDQGLAQAVHVPAWVAGVKVFRQQSQRRDRKAPKARERWKEIETQLKKLHAESPRLSYNHILKKTYTKLETGLKCSEKSFIRQARKHFSKTVRTDGSWLIERKPNSQIWAGD